jgi:hypothetical protein
MTTTIKLQLGDIIQLYASSNNDINNKIFMIDYIDQSKIKLKNDDTTYQLNIDDTGNLKDESIESIDLLNRSSDIGYAKQNNLLPNTWIDIYFNGNIPVTYTGIITSLEEDMIEIKLYPSNDLIYLDFEYKGLPESLPIEKINIRISPDDIKKTQKKSDKLLDGKEKSMDKRDDEDNDDNEDNEEPSELENIDIPLTTIKKTIKDMLLTGDQIKIGDKLETINQIIDVPEEEKRYSIESQANDLLDELISTIPNVNRTESVLNNLHTMVQRYKELRTNFSKFDDNDNVVDSISKGSNYKPLVNNLLNLNKNLHWLLLVANNKKKIYDIDKNENSYDIVQFTLPESLVEYNNIHDDFKSNNDNYDTYFKKLNSYLLPFDETNEILYESSVMDNLNVVIDNLEDMYSSVVSSSNINRQRFLITKYNLGLNKLSIKDKKGSKVFTEIKKLTPNDMINIKSILTLPYTVVKYSHINLPNTNIMIKSHLNNNIFQYWPLLKENTSYNKTIVNNFTELLKFDTNFVKKINNYMLNESINEIDKYKKFLEIIIPKSRKIFELQKNNINNVYSLFSLLKEFEPYLIYLDDISFKLYEDLLIFIDEQINGYKNNMRVNRDELFFKLYNRLKSLDNYNSASEKNNDFTLLFNLIKTSKGIENDVFNEYAVSQPEINTLYTSSEILTKMMHLDLSRLYFTSISYISTDLLMPFDYNILLNEENSKYKDQVKNYENKNNCEKYVLSKKYLNLDILTDDNNKEIYFDKEYDTTIYDIKDEYNTEQSEMEPTDFKLFLVDKLMINVGLTKEKALYEAEAMIEKKRKVINGDYAVLKINNVDTIQYFYYKRLDKVWERDESIPENIDATNNDLFCNLKEKCTTIKNDSDDVCVSYPLGSELVKKSIINNIYDEFEDTYVLNKNQLTKKINEEYSQDLYNLSKYKLINHSHFYKYNDYLISLIKDVDKPEIVVSPNKKILNEILGGEDFIKKQKQIISFVQKYTREANDLIDNKTSCKYCEGLCMYWLYCTDTNTKILPTFVYRLACAFFEKENYALELDIICDNQGTLSDDNEKWVDKHSGWDIKYNELSSDQGYDSGFKLITHDFIKKTDLSEDLLNKDIKIENPVAIMITNVVKTLGRYMGIVMDRYQEFIVTNTLDSLNNLIDDEQTYNLKSERFLVERGKKLPSYKDHFNQLVLYLTCGYILIAIQTSIPSVITKKTFPGCKKSFEGYPLFDDEDLSALNYISCITYKIKSAIEPWNTIKKLKEVSISQKIKASIDSVILKKTNVISLIHEKNKYLQSANINDLPLEINLKNWGNFLPPMQKINNGTPENISSIFKKNFVDNLKKGTKNIDTDVNVIKSKIMYFSLAIQELIQTIVEKEKPLLSANGVPYTQNTCCNTGNINTLQYFIEKDRNIFNYNIIVSDLKNILYDYNNLIYASYLVDPINTKFIYPKLENIYSEKTIYMAIINFCNFDNTVEVSDELIKFCLTKPDDYNEKDTLENKINILKKNGNNYTQKTMMQLLDIVNRNNIVNIDLVNDSVSLIQKLRNLLDYCDNRKSIIDKEFITLFLSVLDTYALDTDSESSDLRNFKNFLAINIDSCKENINTFIKQYGKLADRKYKKCVDFYKNIANFKNEEDDELFFKSINYMKNALFYISCIFPNIIINKVNYENIKIPKYWGLSSRHISDIKTLISDNYILFKSFYSDEILSQFLNKINNDTTILKMFSDVTPIFINIEKNDGSIIKPILDKRSIKLIYEYYFFTSMCSYISLVNDEKVSKTNLPSNTPLSDIMSLDEIDDIANDQIIQGNQMLNREKIAKLLVSYYEILNDNKSEINYTRQDILEAVNRSKDKEKDNVTKKLGDLNIEEREIENLFKKHKLERWDKGLQKGLVQYVGKTYDEERTEDERMLNLEMRAQNQNVDIDDIENEEIINREIEREENDMSNQPEDDDYDQDHGEAYGLEYEENEN